MSSVIWNALGLRGKHAFLLLKQLVADLKPLLLFVSESKVSIKVTDCWLLELCFNGVVGVDVVGTRGGLLLFWSNKIDVSLCPYSYIHIDVCVVWESFKWRFTSCYAHFP